jgi:hypothetical protein
MEPHWAHGCIAGATRLLLNADVPVKRDFKNAEYCHGIFQEIRPMYLGDGFSAVHDPGTEAAFFRSLLLNAIFRAGLRR